MDEIKCFFNEAKKVKSLRNFSLLKLEGAHLFQKPYETEPSQGNHKLETCQDCQQALKVLTDYFTNKFEKFPDCCEAHKQLTQYREFNRDDFTGVPEMVARKIIYTHNHIKNHHSDHDYYDKITHYIDYTVESFGYLFKAEPLFLSDYLERITFSLEQNTEIENSRKKRLIDYLAKLRGQKKEQRKDIELLISTYEEWLNLFPFDISFFSELRKNFENNLPIFKSVKINKYSREHILEPHTKSSLIDCLLNLTNDILTQINTATLYEKGLLTEPQKIKLELVLNERKMKLKQGYVNSLKDEEQRYIEILKEWFEDEKRFIDEITPIVKALPPQPISVNESRTKKVIIEAFTNMNKQGWKYAFVSEQDFNLFTDLLTNFFEYKPYTLPETIIQLRRGCKTNVAKALGEIHRELSNENTLKGDTKYFELVRVLSHFKKEKESDLYKALTR